MREQRRDLKRSYRESGPTRGICQVRHLESGRVYVEAAENVEGRHNRNRFALKMGTYHVPALLADYRVCGEAGFAFETVAVLTAEEAGDDPAAALAVLESTWRAQLAEAGTEFYVDPTARR
jgi:hypothetical protein